MWLVRWHANQQTLKLGGLYTPPHIPCGVRAEDSPRTLLGPFLAEAEAKFENPSPSLVLGQSLDGVCGLNSDCLSIFI